MRGVEDVSAAYQFDQVLECWTLKETSGCIWPSGLKYCAYASADHHIYIHGGQKGFSDIQNSLYLLNVRTMTLSILATDGPFSTGHGIVEFSNQLLLVLPRESMICSFDLKEGMCSELWLLPPPFMSGLVQGMW